MIGWRQRFCVSAQILKIFRKSRCLTVWKDPLKNHRSPPFSFYYSEQYRAPAIYSDGISDLDEFFSVSNRFGELIANNDSAQRISSCHAVWQSTFEGHFSRRWFWVSLGRTADRCACRESRVDIRDPPLKYIRRHHPLEYSEHLNFQFLLAPSIWNY